MSDQGRATAEAGPGIRALAVVMLLLGGAAIVLNVASGLLGHPLLDHEVEQAPLDAILGVVVGGFALSTGLLIRNGDPRATWTYAAWCLSTTAGLTLVVHDTLTIRDAPLYLGMTVVLVAGVRFIRRSLTD